MNKIMLDYYADRVGRDDVIYRYSRTARALNAESRGRFDAVLADVAQRTAESARRYDSVLAESAERYSLAKDIPGRYDPVLSRRRGEILA